MIHVSLKVTIKLFRSHVKYPVNQGRVGVGILEGRTSTCLTHDWTSFDNLVLKRMQVKLEGILNSGALFLLLKSHV